MFFSGEIIQICITNLSEEMTFLENNCNTNLSEGMTFLENNCNTKIDKCIRSAASTASTGGRKKMATHTNPPASA